MSIIIGGPASSSRTNFSVHQDELEDDGWRVPNTIPMRLATCS